MTTFPARRALIALFALAFLVTGCGKSHKSAESSVVSVTTASVPANGAAGAVSTPIPQSSDPDVVGASIDSSLNDINADLSAVDSAPTDEGDPTS